MKRLYMRAAPPLAFGAFSLGRSISFSLEEEELVMRQVTHTHRETVSFSRARISSIDSSNNDLAYKLVSVSFLHDDIFPFSLSHHSTPFFLMHSTQGSFNVWKSYLIPYIGSLSSIRYIYIIKVYIEPNSYLYYIHFN